jgi:hypothetical protein
LKTCYFYAREKIRKRKVRSGPTVQAVPKPMREISTFDLYDGINVVVDGKFIINKREREQISLAHLPHPPILLFTKNP